VVLSHEIAAGPLYSNIKNSLKFEKNRSCNSHTTQKTQQIRYATSIQISGSGSGRILKVAIRYIPRWNWQISFPICNRNISKTSPVGRCPPSSTRERKRRRPSTDALTTATTSPTGKDGVAPGRSKRRSAKVRRSRWADENSELSVLNTAFINADDVKTSSGWRPDISAILPAGDAETGCERARRRPEPEVVLAVGRQVALCERKFADDVDVVISRLSRPLIRRRDIVTSRQHAVLFQNLEKVGLYGWPTGAWPINLI